MCGLVGIFGNIENQHKEMFEDLLRVDVLRGSHSTGIAHLQRKKSKPKIFKGTVLPEILIADENYQNVRNQKTILLMGHNRYATTGEIEHKNSHPFEHGNITLAHNGTIISKWRLDDHILFDTDSEAITNSINKIGIKETWKLIDGAATLVWWDSKYQTLNMLRNDRRPLYYAYFGNEEGIIWASEEWMITQLAKRKNITIVRDKQIWYPPINCLMSFKFNQKNDEVTCDIEKLTEFKTIVTKGYTSGYSNIWRQKDIKKEDMFKDLYKGDDLNNYDDLRAFDGDLNVFQFRQKYNDCLFCDKDLYGDFHDAIILSNYEAACGDCAALANTHNVRLV